MPIYEYHCNTCNHNFEALVFGQDAPEKCPECEKKTIIRLMSACGFVSKGNGGDTVKASAGTSGCSSCGATSCSTCGH